MKRVMQFVLALFLVFVSSAWGGGKSPSCLKPFIEDVVEQLEKDQRDIVYLTVKRADGVGKSGAMIALDVLEGNGGPTVTYGIIQHFNSTVVIHYYSSAEEALAAIGRIGNLTASGTGVVAGTDKMLANLGHELFIQRVGAELDLKVADDIVQNGGRSALLAFQEEVPIPGTTSRFYDVTQACSTCSYGRLYHENKNWITALSGAGDSRLADLGNQFERDIVAHASRNFDSLHFNFNRTVQPQAGVIKQELLNRFASDTVVNSVDTVVLQRAQDRFVILWDSGQIVTFK